MTLIDAEAPPETATADLHAAVSEYVTEILDVTRTPGASIAVSFGDQEAAWAFGVADASTGELMTTDHVFHAGSLSKTVVAVVCMRQVQAGFDLDSPVRELLPYVRNPLGGPPVTVRHLLGHTAGLANDTYMASLRQPAPMPEFLKMLLADGRCVEYAGSRPLWQHPAGQEYCYSSLGIALAAHAAEVFSGRPYEQLAQELFDEAGMRSTSVAEVERADLRARKACGHLRYSDLVVCGPQLRSAIWPSTGMITTPADQVRFLRALKAGELISQDLLDVMAERVSVYDTLGEEPLISGLGLQMQDTPLGFCVGHTGAYASGQWIDARVYDSGLAVVCATNCWDQAVYVNPARRSAYGLITDFVAQCATDGVPQRAGMPAGRQRTAFTAGMVIAERLRAMMSVEELSDEDVQRFAASLRTTENRTLTAAEIVAFRAGLARFAQVDSRALTPDEVRRMVVDGPGPNVTQLGTENLKAGASHTRVPIPFRPFARAARTREWEHGDDG
jgi:CubicO group peptidase (beta-lactamase class C family)